jgi:hypothetical protein
VVTVYNYTIYYLRIGVNGFENPLRDAKTEEFKKQIGSGCKLKMDDTGRGHNKNITIQEKKNKS